MLSNNMSLNVVNAGVGDSPHSHHGLVFKASNSCQLGMFVDLPKRVLRIVALVRLGSYWMIMDVL